MRPLERALAPSGICSLVGRGGSSRSSNSICRRVLLERVRSSRREAVEKKKNLTGHAASGASVQIYGRHVVALLGHTEDVGYKEAATVVWVRFVFRFLFLYWRVIFAPVDASSSLITYMYTFWCACKMLFTFPFYFSSAASTVVLNKVARANIAIHLQGRIADLYRFNLDSNLAAATHSHTQTYTHSPCARPHQHNISSDKRKSMKVKMEKKIFLMVKTGDVA